jgi:hypothetical protein
MHGVRSGCVGCGRDEWGLQPRYMGLQPGCTGTGLKSAAPRRSRPRSTVGAPPPRAQSNMQASAAPTISRARSVARAIGVVAASRCGSAAPPRCSAAASSRTASDGAAPSPALRNLSNSSASSMKPSTERRTAPADEESGTAALSAAAAAPPAPAAAAAAIVPVTAAVSVPVAGAWPTWEAKGQRNQRPWAAPSAQRQHLLSASSRRRLSSQAPEGSPEQSAWASGAAAGAAWAAASWATTKSKSW